MTMRWPLMVENVTHADKMALIEFLAGQQVPRLTQGPQVEAFEHAFANWLGVRHAVMVNSGASANLITMAALKWHTDCARVAVPVITWSSDIMSILHAGMIPVFVDVDPYTLGMPAGRLAQADAVFVTHTLGFDAGEMPCPLLIEDCCEAPGATRDGIKLGTFGLASNFSFYYGHHMTTIEGGMVCTDDADFYAKLKMLRSHGMTRESSAASSYARLYPDLHPEFIFAHPAYNVRSTELNAVLGLAQLLRLDANNAKRTDNLRLFLSRLDADRYRTRYPIEGSSSFALPLVLQENNAQFMGRVLTCLRENGVEYRRGTAGGGNQLRQPYARERWGQLYTQFPEAEHIHHYGVYIGNYPTLNQELIVDLCERINKL